MDHNKRAKKKQKALAREEAIASGAQRKIIHGNVNAGSGSSSFMSYTGSAVNPPAQYNFSGNFSGAVNNAASSSVNNNNYTPALYIRLVRPVG